MISYIIPHKDRYGLLMTHLESLKRSVFNDFEIIIVNDGSEYKIDPGDEGWIVVNLEESHGPARARNIGAFEASGDILFFVGDDCFPTEDLLLHHYLAHQDKSVDIVQGYTGFHQNQMGTHFMTFLDKSGMQANWEGLKKEDGSWVKEINGFFLTTNVSIKKEKFIELGGFSTSFPRAAWEDIEFGTRASRNHYKTVFEPLAVNFHQHGYTYWEFCGRQFMEGTQRLNLVIEHPEMAPSLINPQHLRDIKAQGHELEVINSGLQLGNMSISRFVELQYSLWSEGLQVMSVLGIIDEIDRRGGMWNVFYHIHDQEQVMLVASALRAIHNKDYGYAQHCKYWLLEKHSDNWGLQMLAAEIDRECGDKEMSLYYYEKARINAFNEKWVKEFLA